ncbi:hypothetical protein RLEG3_06355 (plasmid) [Rhizobium leguminosarum bv. trifolii WSM1689]|nr:hypothetical protein RLEG3_06355 [Rhizobium leguminosarum bv. trifolii WSM1689]
MSFSGILDHLDFGAMAIGEARYDRYSIFGDVMYSRISAPPARPEGSWPPTVAGGLKYLLNSLAAAPDG